ncbi:cytochrome c oxidase assembly protein [Streptomyces sp. S.PNR 29]|uniref:cytochrome c oxidase assembly protein n=1 Tax=Streptomyces sp. S.PNR 29 TaxID=2973805 RepID=UPI0025AF619F|nr:cytochrome c oxidase assembly protein [Streptomyces sp. S.PNR 29]MDN0196550.1 cytochrome c oxidase assembly protein [Streptomyces sp. S.PNR 29]
MGSPPELTLGRLLSSWELDVPVLLLVALLGVPYGWGVLRLRRRGERWPLPRLAAFALLGLGTLVVATMSAPAVYAHALFWPAALQNVLLDLVAPLGLALGDPLRLAVRALPERAAGRVRRAMTGRLVRLLTFPLVSTALVLATELTVYFTPYFGTALRHGWLHELMYLHLLLAGCLFVVPVLTREEALPPWCTHPVRAALVFVDGVIDAVPGIAVMTHGSLIAGAWYLHHAPSWAPDVHHDQQLGGGAMIGTAELVALPFLLAILVQWARAERAETAVLDRRLDAELVPAAPAAGPAQGPELVRPWWETENGEVAQRIRQRRPSP